MINPGTDNIPLAKATLEPKGWIVTIEADAKDKSGAAIHYVIEARIENLELPNRSLVGTWRNQRGRGAFESEPAVRAAIARTRLAAQRGVALVAARPRHSRITRSPAKFDETKHETLTRHRDRGRLAQPARARIHERARATKASSNWAVELESTDRARAERLAPRHAARRATR